MIENIPKKIKHDRRLLARVISQIENDTEEGRNELEKLFSFTGNAHIIGITGPSGAGKSTLVDKLVKELIQNNKENKKKIAVVAVDPTSPFTGGAILGDRIRMQSIALNPNIFVRSMASRGALGGIAHATQAVALTLDAAGFDYIVIETVGAGQSEIEIAGLSHTVIVVKAPGMGDDVQAAKAGILEIADILVVNKADKPGTDAAVMALKLMIEMGYPAQKTNDQTWVPPILQTTALHGEGIDQVAEQVLKHQELSQINGGWQTRSQTQIQYFLKYLLEKEQRKHWHQFQQDKSSRRVFDQVYARSLSPYQAIKQLLKQ
jgi:LAO/AO transport system kinase